MEMDWQLEDHSWGIDVCNWSRACIATNAYYGRANNARTTYGVIVPYDARDDARYDGTTSYDDGSSSNDDGSAPNGYRTASLATAAANNHHQLGKWKLTLDLPKKAHSGQVPVL